MRRARCQTSTLRARVRASVQIHMQKTIMLAVQLKPFSMLKQYLTCVCGSYAFSSHFWSCVVVVVGSISANVGYKLHNRQPLPTEAQHQVLAKLTLADFRIPPGYTMYVINRQYIPLEVDNVGCAQALLSRQRASLDFSR